MQLGNKILQDFINLVLYLITVFSESVIKTLGEHIVKVVFKRQKNRTDNDGVIVGVRRTNRGRRSEAKKRVKLVRKSVVATICTVLISCFVFKCVVPFAQSMYYNWVHSVRIDDSKTYMLSVAEVEQDVEYLQNSLKTIGDYENSREKLDETPADEYEDNKDYNKYVADAAVCEKSIKDKREAASNSELDIKVLKPLYNDAINNRESALKYNKSRQSYALLGRDHLDFGWVLYNVGKKSEACKHFEKAAEYLKNSENYICEESLPVGFTDTDIQYSIASAYDGMSECVTSNIQKLELKHISSCYFNLASLSDDKKLVADAAIYNADVLLGIGNMWCYNLDERGYLYHHFAYLNSIKAFNSSMLSGSSNQHVLQNLLCCTQYLYEYVLAHGEVYELKSADEYKQEHDKYIKMQNEVK